MSMFTYPQSAAASFSKRWLQSGALWFHSCVGADFLIDLTLSLCLSSTLQANVKIVSSDLLASFFPLRIYLLCSLFALPRIKAEVPGEQMKTRSTPLSSLLRRRLNSVNSKCAFSSL